MNKIISTLGLTGKSSFYRTSVCAALIAILLLLTLSIVQAQPETTRLEPQARVSQQTEEAGSGSQLRIDVNPLLGLNVLAPIHSPDYYDASVTASGDVAVNVGSPCPSGYTSAVATVGLAWVGDSGVVDIQFVPNQGHGHAVGLLMWDLAAKRWWCTDTLGESSVLHFTNMSQGIYFMWVVTQDSEPVQGEISITSPSATPES